MMILGIDYGKKKIGLAIGDTETVLAEPIKSIISSPPRRRLASFRDRSGRRVEAGQPSARLASRSKRVISDLVKENNIGLIVVGLPGGKMDNEIKNFSKGIEKGTGVSVVFSDETLTTNDAKRILGKIGRKRSYKRKMEDAIAAAIMLQSFLERKEDYV